MIRRRPALRRAEPAYTGPAPAPAWTQDTKSALVPTILVWALFLTMILPPNLNYAVIAGLAAGSKDDQNLPNKIIFISVLIGSCFFISQRQALWVRVVRSLNPFYVLFLLLAALSVTWSIDSDVTARNVFRLSVMFLCFTAFTLNSWRADRFQIVMRTLLGVLVVGSVVFAVAFPDLGVQKFEDYAMAPSLRLSTTAALAPMIKPVLRGLTFGKNQMGQLASFALVFWVHAWIGKETKTRWVLLCGGCALIAIYWAHSSTSILAAAFSVPLLFMLRRWPTWLRRYMPYVLVTFTVLILGYSLVVLRLIPQLDFLLTPVTALTGKDLTFSGRTPIWQLVIEHIMQHPDLGTGYMAYWVNSPDSPSMQFQKILFFYPGESHNGYLEVLNDLGIVGGACLLGFLFTYLRQSVRIMEFDRHQGSLYVVLLFHQFWSSLTESHWFSSGSQSFTVITLAVCTTARTLLQHRFEVDAVRQAPFPHATRTL